MSLLIIVLSLTFGSNALADASAKRHCTEGDAIQVEKEADSLNDWDQVYRSYRRFSQCDDGAIAEGYSDSVSKLLANDWNHFDRLLTLTKTDKPFQQFVLKHINETLSDGVLLTIATNARSNCPRGGQSLCRLIARSADKR